MDYTPVPAKEQENIIRPRRAAWFEALLEHGMLEMSSRPSVSQTQRDVLDARGQRFRSRQMNDKMYVWVEDVPSRDLNESLDDDDLPLPDDEVGL